MSARSTYKFKSDSASKTKRIARELGRKLKAGDVVALRGALGSGKTTFAKGLAKGLGVLRERDVSSPTFVIIHEYQARFPVYHLDWYRLRRVRGADRQLAEECFDGNGVSMIEWPQRGEELLPDERVEVRLSPAGLTTRVIAVRLVGARYKDLYKK